MSNDENSSDGMLTPPCQGVVMPGACPVRCAGRGPLRVSGDAHPDQSPPHACLALLRPNTDPKKEKNRLEAQFHALETRALGL